MEATSRKQGMLSEPTPQSNWRKRKEIRKRRGEGKRGEDEGWKGAGGLGRKRGHVRPWRQREALIIQEGNRSCESAKKRRRGKRRRRGEGGRVLQEISGAFVLEEFRGDLVPIFLIRNPYKSTREHTFIIMVA